MIFGENPREFLALLGERPCSKTVRSIASDSLKETQDKMKEYRDNGAVLGWLINRKSRQVEIYRPNQEVEILQSPTTVSSEDILPGFVLSLESIW